MTGTTFRTHGLDVERLGSDSDYRTRLARRLLTEAGTDVDHVQLRRVAVDVFPDLARREAAPLLARLVGAASTLQRQIRSGGDALDEPGPARRHGSDDPDAAIHLEYPDDYRDMDTRTKNMIIRFCDTRLVEGAEGRQALQQLIDRYGWPYSDRTFYVGPWKAARLRRRKRDARRAAREAREAARAGGSGRAARTGRDPAAEDDVLDDLDAPEASSPGRERETAPAFPTMLDDERDISFSTERADYSARRLDSGEWAVSVRARLDANRMRRLHSQAAELFFPRVGEPGPE